MVKKSAKQKFVFTMVMDMKEKKELWRRLIVLNMTLRSWIVFNMIFLTPLQI